MSCLDPLLDQKGHPRDRREDNWQAHFKPTTDQTLSLSLTLGRKVVLGPKKSVPSNRTEPNLVMTVLIVYFPCLDIKSHWSQREMIPLFVTVLPSSRIEEKIPDFHKPFLVCILPVVTVLDTNQIFFLLTGSIECLIPHLILPSPYFYAHVCTRTQVCNFTFTSRSLLFNFALILIVHLQF